MGVQGSNDGVPCWRGAVAPGQEESPRAALLAEGEQPLDRQLHQAQSGARNWFFKIAACFSEQQVHLLSALPPITDFLFFSILNKDMVLEAPQ